MKHIYITLLYFSPLRNIYMLHDFSVFRSYNTNMLHYFITSHLRNTFVLHNLPLRTCVTYFCYMPSQLLKWNTYILHNFATLGVKHICVTRLCTSIKICAKTKCKHFMNQSGTCWGQRTKSAEKAFEHRRMPLLKGFFEKRSKTAYLDCRGVLRYNIGEKRALKAKNRLFC